ncbi:hypothetical protein GJ744_009425 [Endocarpon pusillum]|uniref:Uncharacterized protein n=1 Tax=Endocarpon pusillum TaxID=364733 RepID=A0A8H7ANG7_9EURO|nr:hypothetical protein GJ744_009425 [Endocarpon pusillum]
MRLLVLVLALLGVCATASPIVYKASGVAKRVDADEAVVYPDEQFYAEDFKRSVDADESVVYPDEEFYAEDFK